MVTYVIASKATQPFLPEVSQSVHPLRYKIKIKPKSKLAIRQTVDG